MTQIIFNDKIVEKYILDEEIVFNDNIFRFIVKTTTPFESVNLPVSGNLNFTVDYGDYSGIKTVTSYSDPDTTHIYTVPKSYTIQISGLCESFSVGLYYNPPTTFALQLYKIISWGYTGLKYLSLSNCHNLTYIPNDKQAIGQSEGIGAFSNINIHGLYWCFYNCYNLKEIPEDLFKYVRSNEDSFYGVFQGCTSLTTIPENLFKYNINITNFTLIFMNCYSLTTIPENLFKYNTKVTNFAGSFMYCTNLTTIPENLFKYNIEVTNFENLFFNSGLITIPNYLFKYNTKTLKLRSSFEKCYSLTTIPEYLFDTLINTTDFGAIFQECSGITSSIPEHLFDNCVSLNYIAKAFYKCYRITGNAPALWITYSHLTVEQYIICFTDCIGLSNYASIPVGWK